MRYTLDMKLTRLENNGNSAKFRATTKNGEFIIALSFTLRTKIWNLTDPETELKIASELAEAIVSRHDHTHPFQKIYVFAEHNIDSDFSVALKKIRKHGY